MLDLRYLAVALVIGTFMAVTVGHVANYAGSFESAGVAVFVKQLDIGGRISKDPDEWPEELRVREYPE